MRKRSRLILATLTLAAVAGLGGAILLTRSQHPPDPAVNGHLLSYWLTNTIIGEHRVDGSGGLFVSDIPQSDQAEVVSYLIGLIRARNSSMHDAYARVWPHLPFWLQARTPAPATEWPELENAYNILGYLGTNARPAIPELIQIVKNNNYAWTYLAAESLGRIANGNDKNAIAALVSAATHSDGTPKEEIWLDIIRLDPAAAAKAGITNLEQPTGAAKFE